MYVFNVCFVSAVGIGRCYINSTTEARHWSLTGRLMKCYIMNGVAFM